MTGSNEPDYYDVLDLKPTASAPMIRAAYRLKAKDIHPDRAGAEGAMARLNEAYAVLSSPGRRSEYDRGLAREREKQASAPEAEQPVVDDWGRETSWADVSQPSAASSAGNQQPWPADPQPGPDPAPRYPWEPGGEQPPPMPTPGFPVPGYAPPAPRGPLWGRLPADRAGARPARVSTRLLVGLSVAFALLLIVGGWVFQDADAAVTNAVFLAVLSVLAYATGGRRAAGGGLLSNLYLPYAAILTLFAWWCWTRTDAITGAMVTAWLLAFVAAVELRHRFFTGR